MKIRNKYGYAGIRKLYGEIVKALGKGTSDDGYVVVDKVSREVKLSTPYTKDYVVKIPLGVLLENINKDNTDDLTMDLLSKRITKLLDEE